LSGQDQRILFDDVTWLQAGDAVGRLGRSAPDEVGGVAAGAGGVVGRQLVGQLLVVNAEETQVNGAVE